MILWKINARCLSVPTCDEMHPVHTVVLNLEDPLVFHTPTNRGHKTFACLELYLLLVHVSKFFLIASHHFMQDFALRWFQVLVKVLGSSGTGLVSVVTIAKSMRKFKFFYSTFFLHCLLDNLLASSSCKAWSFFIAHTTFMLTVVWGVALTWSLISLSKNFHCLFQTSLVTVRIMNDIYIIIIYY